ncbi:MAG: MFS transporter [Candidatus Bathyarchaeota archaeon]|nr:MAG: MFS transporter [Candidatus Bathyarchaeota archaeon]
MVAKIFRKQKQEKLKRKKPRNLRKTTEIESKLARDAGRMENESLVKLLDTAPVSRFHYGLLIICSLAYALTGMGVMLISVLLTPIGKEWGLSPVTKGMLASAGYVGMFFGAIGCGFLADLVGRKKTLLFTIVLSSIFTALCAVAWDVSSMAVLRFLAGIGLGGALPQPGVYVSEYTPAKYRGRFLGITETSWVYGVLLGLFSGWLLVEPFGWRIVFLVALVSLILVPSIFWVIPESIRYLEEKRQRREAAEILRKRGLTSVAVTSKKSEVGLHKKHGGRLLVKSALREMWSSSYWKRTAVLWILWIVLVYTYHGIFIWLPSIYATELGFPEVRAIWFVMVVTLFQIPGYYSATFLLDRFGRKPVLIGYLALAGVGSYLLGFSGDVSSILVWSSVISFFNLGAWAGLYTYTPELYPTRMRGSGSGVAASLGRFAGIFAPTITPLLLVSAGLWLPFAVFALAHGAAALSVAVLGTETKGRILEEIAE